MVFRRSALDLVMPRDPDALRICTDWYVFVVCHYLTGSLAIGSALGAYRRHGNNNFASNPIMGSRWFSSLRQSRYDKKTVVSVMIYHLLDNYDRFSSVSSSADVRKLVRILYSMALRDNVSIQVPHLRAVLGTRGMVEAKVRTRLSFLRRLTRLAVVATHG